MGLRQLYYCFIYLFIASLVLTGASFSRFSTTITNTGAENTGSPGNPQPPDIEFSTWAIDYEAATVSLKDLEPGDVKTVRIWIKNKNRAGKVSGYNQNVTLELKTTGNLPLNFTLRKKDGTPVVFNQRDPSRYVSENQSFTANEEEIKEYTLTISWPEEFSDYKYRDEIDYIELKLTAVQA